MDDCIGPNETDGRTAEAVFVSPLNGTRDRPWAGRQFEVNHRVDNENRSTRVLDNEDAKGPSQTECPRPSPT